MLKVKPINAQGMKAYKMWNEAVKFFGASPGSKLPPQVHEAVKDLQLSDVSLGDFLTDKYALWLDFRTSDDDKLHGSGRRLENINNGITLQITKASSGSGPITAHVYIFMDAQLNIVGGRYDSVVY